MAVCRSLYDTDVQELRDLVYSIALNASHPIHEFAKKAKLLATRGYRPADTAADWIEIASDLKGDFSSLTTPSDYENVIKIYYLDLAAVLMITICFISWRLGMSRGRKKATKGVDRTRSNQHQDKKGKKE